MNPQAQAIRLGLRRGWTESVQSIRSSQDQGFYIFTALLVLGYLYLRRNSDVEGSDLSFPSVSLPEHPGCACGLRRRDRAGVRARDGP